MSGRRYYAEPRPCERCGKSFRPRKDLPNPRYCSKACTIKHGHAMKDRADPTYSAWRGMKRRCSDPGLKTYPAYGGRGITICERWREFGNFLTDMGLKPPGTSLDRIDNNGNYEPGNCRWATRREQDWNTSRVRFIEAHGLRLPITEWMKRNRVAFDTIMKRLKAGASPEEAVRPWDRPVAMSPVERRRRDAERHRAKWAARPARAALYRIAVV